MKTCGPRATHERLRPLPEGIELKFFFYEVKKDRWSLRESARTKVLMLIK